MTLRSLALAAAAVLAAAMPAVSLADTSSTEYVTSLTEVGDSAPYTGRLQLTDVGGIIHGYYFSSDGTAMFSPVVGGIDGSSVWLDIGSGDTLVRVEGRINGSRISGSAYESTGLPLTFDASKVVTQTN